MRIILLTSKVRISQVIEIIMIQSVFLAEKKRKLYTQ